MARHGLECASPTSRTAADGNVTDVLLDLDGWVKQVDALEAERVSAVTRAETLLCALQAARRAVLLFPHHDTITGTSQVRACCCGRQTERRLRGSPVTVVFFSARLRR